MRDNTDGSGDDSYESETLGCVRPVRAQGSEETPVASVPTHRVLYILQLASDLFEHGTAHRTFATFRRATACYRATHAATAAFSRVTARSQLTLLIEEVLEQDLPAVLYGDLGWTS